MNDQKRRRPDFSLYAVKKIPRGEKHKKEDYTNLVSIWLDEKYDATFRPECRYEVFARAWEQAFKGPESSITIKIRGLTKVASTSEAKNYASKIIESISGHQASDSDDDDVPF